MSKQYGFRVGDVVRFQSGKRKLIGSIKEDRGSIGVNGRNLYLVEFSTEPSYSSQVELPGEQLEQPTTWAILEFGNGTPSKAAGHNVTSVTDNGGGRGEGVDLTLTFGEPMSDDLYPCQVSANVDVTHRIVKKSDSSVRLVIEDPLPQRVRIVCGD